MNSDNKLKIISGDPEYPLIYLESSKKYLLTYQLKEDDEDKSGNQTQRSVYAYRYAQIGSEPRPTELHISLGINDSQKHKVREEEIELDRFLLSVIEKQDKNIMNSIKSITIVDARYD